MNFFMLFMQLQLINVIKGLSFAAGQACTMATDFSPFPGDCTKYLRCKNNIFVASTCPTGTRFDYTDKVCNSDFFVARCYSGSRCQGSPW